MAVKTKSQLISENKALLVRLAELESITTSPLPGNEVPVENNLVGSELSLDELKTSENRYRRLFETTQDGILIIDANSGRIEDANPYMEDMLGYRQDELEGKYLWEIGLFKDITANQDMYQELKKNRYVRYEDLPLLTKMGEQKQVEFVSNTYAVDNRIVIQCNIRDISARKDVEAKTEINHAELVALVAELQRHDNELQSLYNLNDLIQSCNTQDEAFQVIRMLGSKLFEGQNGCLAILRPTDQSLEVAVCWGTSGFMEANFFLSDCWALRRGQVHIVPHPPTGLVCTHFSQPAQTGYLCVPLMVQGETLGMLCITGLDEKRMQRQQQLAVIVGDSIKLSLSNLRLREKLREQALTDQLTGLGNRHYLENYLSHEMSRLLRRGASVCVAMLDLDHFKEFNDTHGHDAGDMLLHKLGDLLHSNLRQNDLICRYGGEEFVIVLIDSPLTEVQQRLEKIREMVKAIEIQHGMDHFGGVTLSIGLVEAHGDDWTTSRLLQVADESLYAAKRAGRDRIVVYPALE